MKFKVRELLKLKGIKFRLGFLNWGIKRKPGTLLRYYRKPKDDTRSLLGKRVDTVVGMFLVWLATFLLLAGVIGEPAMALAVSIPFFIAEALLLKKIGKIREQRRIYQKGLWVKGQKLMESMAQMDTSKEFRPYVRDLLAGLPGFQDLRLVADNQSGLERNKEGIDLEGLYRGLPVAIRCIQQEGDKQIAPNEVRDFALSLRLWGYKNGLFITSGDFRPGVLRVLQETARKGINIKLVDRYRLVDLARQAGCGVFQDEMTQTTAPLRTAGGWRWPAFLGLRDSALGSRKKAKSYFLYSVLLYGGYILLKGESILSMVYLFFAGVNVLLGAGCLYFGKNLEEMDPLEELGPEQ